MFRNRSCTRVSSVSSGWKAATSSRPSRASTGWPSTSASTSTSGPASSSHGARMKTARSGSLPSPDVEVGLEAAHLAAERVAPRPVVAQTEVVAVEHDHPGARTEDRAAEPAHRLVEAVQPHEPADRGRLAARDDQPVEPVEVLGEPDFDRLGAEPAQHGGVLAEVPLHGEDADPERLLHASMVTRLRPASAGRAEVRQPHACAARAGRGTRARSRGARSRAPAPRGRGRTDRSTGRSTRSPCSCTLVPH